MDAKRENEPAPTMKRTTVERKSERKLVITRTINGPARIVFEALYQARAAQAVVGTEVHWRVPALPARRMFVSGAGTVWCSATTPPQSLWNSSVGTSK
jgi:hypothetical protein